MLPHQLVHCLAVVANSLRSLVQHGSGKAHIGHLGPHGQGKAKAATAKTATSLNNMMMQLRKVCNHP